MARNDSPDSEFDEEMERVLREHFESSSPDLRSPSDPWPWLESRLVEPEPPPFFPRLLGGLNPMRQGRLSPAFAIAGVAVVAVAVAAVVWATSGNGGTEILGGEEGLARVQPTTAPASAATRAPMAVRSSASATTAPRSQAVRPTAAAGAAAPSRPTASAASAAPAATTAPAAVPAATTGPSAVAAPTAAPAPTVAPATTAKAEQAIVAEEPEAQVEEAEEAPAAMAMATPAPLATAAPAMESMRGPAGRCGTPSGPPCPPTSADSPAGPAGTAGVAGTTPADTTFRDYQRQPFVAASEDNFSTFSLDTDRTSFQLALNWARAGYEIDPDSVRAEEWLNAFNYEYDPPTRSDEFAVTDELFPHPLDEDKRLARITFQAPELVDSRPLNVTLVLDASGSMADGNRVDIARQAAESIRQGLGSDDRIAVVHFTQDVLDQYTVEHTRPEDDRVRDSISWLQPHGSTNVQAGLNLGVRLADEVRERRPDAYNYVILMSDGVANVDATDPFAILETAYDPNTRNPLRLITVGVGINNYNDPLLEQLAQHGNGWYRYLDSPGQARATFTRDNWLALSTPFADQTRAQVVWNPGTVERWRIIGYENRVTADENFTQDRKEFAEIYSGAATTVLYELELTEVALSSPTANLGTVELRWVDPDSGVSRGQTNAVSGDPGADFDGRDGSLAHFGAIVALAADLYGGLPGYPVGAFAGVHSGISALQSQLRSLRGELGTLDAYNDFSFLLDHIADGLEDRLPPLTPSGYSR